MLLALLGSACEATQASSVADGGATSAADAVGGDHGGDAAKGADPFADRVVSFHPGKGSGYGQNKMPGVVLGPPDGNGAQGGSLDVVSLGQDGTIVLALDDIGLIDGPGPDLLVFENAFSSWVETGIVAVSEDGETWLEWPCAASDAAGGFAGCAGVHPVFASLDNGIDPTDPAVAGGDAFDLHDLGITHARFVRIRDSGANHYDAPSGGFDLDAIAVVHGAPITP